MAEIDVTCVRTLGITKRSNTYEQLAFLGSLVGGIFLATDMRSAEAQIPLPIRTNLTLLVTDMTAPEVMHALFSDMPKWQFTRVILLTRLVPSDPLPEIDGIEFRYVDPDREAGRIQRWMRSASRQGSHRRLAA